jgi:hypothetical protein
LRGSADQRARGVESALPIEAVIARDHSGLASSGLEACADVAAFLERYRQRQMSF